MSGRGVSTPEGSAKKAPESAQHKRKSTEGDSGARERGERGGRKRSKAVGEEVKIVETTVTAIAATTAARREPDRRIYQYSISEGVPFQPCEQPYEVEDSGVGLGFNFWMTHRELLTEDLQDVLEATAMGDRLPPYLRRRPTPKHVVVVCAQGVCPMALAKALPRCSFLSNCSSMPLRHATTHGKQWRPSEAVQAPSLLMWSQFPTVPFSELQRQSVAEILSSYTCLFDADHPQWRDSLSFAATDVRTHPKFVAWQTEHPEAAEQVQAAGKFFRERVGSSGVWVLALGKLILLWNRWDPEELVAGPWDPNVDKSSDRSTLTFQGTVDLDQKQLPFTLELVCAMRMEGPAGATDEESEERSLLADKYTVTPDNIADVLVEMEALCRGRLHEVLISYDHMNVLGYPRDGSADGYLDLTREPPVAMDTFYGGDHSEEGEVSDSDISELVAADEPATGMAATPHSLVAVDCEMCYTEAGLELTRLSLVSGTGEVVYDEYVRPSLPIVNYNTEYSGVTEEHIRSATKTLADVHKDLRQLMTPQTVLVGHSVDSDLKAMKLVHKYIIDTAACYPHPKGPPYKHSLKSLVRRLFGIDIQAGSGTTGHDSVQDAQMALLLAYAKILEGEQLLLDPPSEAYFPRRQFLPAHIHSLMRERLAADSRNTAAAQFRLVCSTVSFNKLWERSLDGGSLASDIYYCLQELDNTGIIEREETATAIRLRTDRAAVECVKHSTGCAAIETFVSQLKQASPDDEASTLFYLDLPCSISSEAEPPLRSRRVRYPVLPGEAAGVDRDPWASHADLQASDGFELVRTLQHMEEVLQSIHSAMPEGALMMVVTQGEIQELKHSMVWKQLSKWDSAAIQPPAPAAGGTATGSSASTSTSTPVGNGTARRPVWDDEHERELTILAAHALSGAVFLRTK